MKSFPRILFVISIIILTTGCSTAKMAGDSLIIGSNGPSNPYSTVMSAVGHALSFGADIASSNSSPQDIPPTQSAQWTKPMAIKETMTLKNHIMTLEEDRKADLQDLVARAANEAQTGIFKDIDSQMQTDLYAYAEGKWFYVKYKTKNSSDNIVMWCNKKSENCILSLEREHVDLPIFTDIDIAMHKRLKGYTAKAGKSPGGKMYQPKCYISPRDPEILAEYFGDNFNQSIKNTLLDANIFDENSQVTLSVKINKIWVDEETASWNADIEMRSSNGLSYPIKETYPVKIKSAESRCDDISNASDLFAEYLYNKSIEHPDFLKLFKV